MLWFFVILVVFTYILNSITLKYGLVKIDYTRSFSKSITEIDEPFEMVMTVVNKKLLPVTFLQITERIPSPLNYQSIKNDKDSFADIQKEFYDFSNTMYILPYQRVERRYTLSGRKRGRYILRGTSLKLGDFIGLKNIYKDIEGFQELIVLPRRLDLDESLESYGSYSGDISIRRWIIDDPLMTIGIREYTGNEPENHIHWPSSLKHGELMVKNFDFTTDNRVNIILNVESNKPFWENIRSEDIETCISLCRGLIEELEEFKIPYDFTTNSHSLSNIKGGFSSAESSNYYDILNILGGLTYYAAYEFENFLDNIFKTHINFTTFIIITPKIFESYIEPIERLKDKNNKLILISLEEDNLDKLSSSIIKYIRKNN